MVQQIGRTRRINVAIPVDGDIRKLLIPNQSYEYLFQVERIFIDKGTVQDINALLSVYDGISQNVLRGVCSNGDRFDLFDHLLSLGVVPDKVCLGNAAISGNMDMVDRLLSLGCPMPKDILYFIGDVEMATKLILYEAKIDHCKVIFGTPLEHAIETDNIAMVELLLSFGAQVTEKLINLAKERDIQPIIQALEQKS